MPDADPEETHQLSRLYRTFVAFAPGLGMIALISVLLFRIAHEVDSGQIKRLLILFPIIAVPTVFLTRWWRERLRSFAIRFLIVLGIGMGILLFA